MIEEGKENIIVLATIEFDSIAIGIKSLDEMAKEAPINIIDAFTICPGKYIIVFSGDVASVEYAYNKGLECGSKHIIDKLYLPMVEQSVINAIGKVVETQHWDAVGIIETLSITAAIQAADVAANVGDIDIVEIRLSIGYGGKSYIKIMGRLEDVEIAIQESEEVIKYKTQYFTSVVIPQPHSEIKTFFYKT
ncbi:MAG: propanediol utilization protein [Marinilabiliales bacterium]|nr:MAG: propanediol utilization protein [Marinilabiliales bacterium]